MILASASLILPVPVNHEEEGNDSIETTLGWEPKIQLEEGLVKVIEYMKGIDWNSVRMPNLVNNMDTIMKPKI